MNSTILIVLLNGSLWQIISQLSTFGAFILAILLVMSLFSWLIIFRKIRQFRASDSDSSSFLTYFRRSRKIDEAAGQAQSYKLSPIAGIYTAGFKELTGLRETKNEAGGLRDTQTKLTLDEFDLVEMAMERSLTEELNILEKQVIFLATTASSAPFLGLLGTVVGIMDSFWSIGERGSASLAVVAPGIAEALLATIVGLGAAIPAVIAYNWASNRMKLLHLFAGNFMMEFISRARKEGW